MRLKYLESEDLFTSNGFFLNLKLLLGEKIPNFWPIFRAYPIHGLSAIVRRDSMFWYFVLIWQPADTDCVISMGSIQSYDSNIRGFFDLN